MCGIAGIINFDGTPIDRQTIEEFTNSMAHRGPDGIGVWIDNEYGVALGHRRLSIFDKSPAGNQPMAYADDRYYLTFNGEIYNFIEIRKELIQKGYCFRTQADSEVVLAAYIEWGQNALLRFNGMWAFAIYDKKNRMLFMARDRFGIKPFLYRHTQKQFAFASELKAFKKLKYFFPSINHETSKQFLADPFKIEGAFATMISEVFKLPAGHFAILHNNQFSINRWWNTLDHLIQVPASFDRQVEQFYEIFTDAVKLRMRSDVPIGSCLSGGFDSTSVVCEMSKIGQQKHKRQAENFKQTFSMIFPGAFNDEQNEAETVAKYTGMKINFYKCDEKTALNDIDKVLYDLDDVYIGYLSPIWQVYRQMRKSDVQVSIDGHGADELMGAYTLPEKALFENAPSLVLFPFENLNRIYRYLQVIRRFRQSQSNVYNQKHIISALIENHPSLKTINNILPRIFSNKTKHNNVEEFIEPGVIQNNMESDLKIPQQSDSLPKDWNATNRQLYHMFHVSILPTILRNFDRLSMAHGIEIRMPFMDYRLVQFVFSLPGASKIGDGQTKRIARAAMRHKIPESIRRADFKMGFNSPMPEWFNGPMKRWIQDIVNDSLCLNHDLIQGKRFARYVEKMSTQGRWSWHNCCQAWKYINLLWFEKEFCRR